MKRIGKSLRERTLYAEHQEWRYTSFMVIATQVQITVFDRLGMYP